MYTHSTQHRLPKIITFAFLISGSSIDLILRRHTNQIGSSFTSGGGHTLKGGITKMKRFFLKFKSTLSRYRDQVFIL